MPNETVLPYSQIQHALIQPGHMHQLPNWSVATIAARNALNVSAEDLLKVCYIQQGREFYALTSVSPVVWTVVGNNGIYAIQTTVTPIAGVLDVSSHDFRVYNVLLNQNVNAVYLGSNNVVDICVQKTLIFWQQGSGGYNVNVAAWPDGSILRWENGMFPLIDTSNQGVTSIEFMYPFGQKILGVQ